MARAVGAMPRAVGVLGGTFDPIHVGHLLIAAEVLDRCGLDEIVFVPAGEPWQKAGMQIAAAEDRYLMTVLATASDERFRVSRVDLDRSGPTYTVDTLRDLHRELGPEVELSFIVGADALAGLPTWREPEEVVRLARLIGVVRPGYALADPGLPNVDIVDVAAVDVSSREIRRRVAAGLSIRQLVPDPVLAYIAKRGLYRQDCDAQ